MPRHELRHLEHRHALLPAKHDLQHVIRVDLGPLLCVLQLVLLDVVSEFFGQFATGDGLGTDDFGQSFVGLDGLHQSWIHFANGGFLGCRHRAFIAPSQGRAILKTPNVCV